jgi:hypothetical protein
MVSDWKRLSMTCMTVLDTAAGAGAADYETSRDIRPDHRLPSTFSIASISKCPSKGFAK